MKNVPREKRLLAKDVQVCQRQSESSFLTNAPRFPKCNYFLEGSQASLFGREQHADEYGYGPVME
jgi:hypothetical protein